jgi:hypothetical protein
MKNEEQVIVEEVKTGQEVVVEAKSEEPKIKLSKFADIFITENDTFDVTVRYYKRDGVLIVSEIDDSFDVTVPHEQFTATIKYPDQGDYTKISRQIKSGGAGLEQLDIVDFMALEFARLVCLIRSWTIDKNLTNENIMAMSPKIVKSMLVQVTNKLGTDGII